MAFERNQTVVARFLDHTLRIYAGAIVADLNDDAAGTLVGKQCDRTFLRFSGRPPALRHFDAVVHRVADDVREWVAQSFDHRLVDLGCLTEGLEPGPFSSLDREFTNQSRHALKNRTNRLSAHRHD